MQSRDENETLTHESLNPFTPTFFRIPSELTVRDQNSVFKTPSSEASAFGCSHSRLNKLETKKSRKCKPKATFPIHVTLRRHRMAIVRGRDIRIVSNIGLLRHSFFKRLQLLALDCFAFQ